MTAVLVLIGKADTFPYILHLYRYLLSVNQWCHAPPPLLNSNATLPALSRLYGCIWLALMNYPFFVGHCSA